MKLVRYLLNIVLVCSIGVLLILQNKTKQSDQENCQFSNSSDSIITDEVLAFFPQATSLISVPNVWTEVYDKEKMKLGYVVYTAPYSDEIVGFAGKTPLLIALDKKQKIIGTKILNNNESESYLQYVAKEGLYDNWNGLTISEALNKQVDAISGATYTSEGVINSLKARLAVLNKSDYYQQNSILSIIKRICSLLIIAFAVFCFFNPKKTKPYRLYLLGLSVIVLGFWQGTFLSLAKMNAAMTGSIPLLPQIVFWIILILSIVLPLVTRKQFYCMWLCPFGALQELIGKFTKKKINIPVSVSKVLVFLRKIILLGIIFWLIIGLTFDLSYLEPFSAFNIQSASAFVLIFAGLFLVLSAFITKPWCRFLCPTGQLLDTCKDISFKNIRWKTENNNGMVK